MKISPLVVIIGVFLFAMIPTANAQIEIDVDENVPCFFNYTASYHILENCIGDSGDYFTWIFLGWNWVTGGFFPMIIVSLIMGIVYMHYREAIYVIYIGFLFLPISAAFFPAVFLSWAFIMAFVAVGILIWYALIRQTQ